MNHFLIDRTLNQSPEPSPSDAQIRQAVDAVFDPSLVMNAVNPYPPLSQRWFIFARYWAGKYHQP